MQSWSARRHPASVISSRANDPSGMRDPSDSPDHGPVHNARRLHQHGAMKRMKEWAEAGRVGMSGRWSAGRLLPPVRATAVDAALEDGRSSYYGIPPVSLIPVIPPIPLIPPNPAIICVVCQLLACDVRLRMVPVVYPRACSRDARHVTQAVTMVRNAASGTRGSRRVEPPGWPRGRWRGQGWSSAGARTCPGRGRGGVRSPARHSCRPALGSGRCGASCTG